MLQRMHRSTVHQNHAERSLSCYYHLLLVDVNYIGNWDAIYKAANELAKLTIYDILDFPFVLN